MPILEEFDEILREATQQVEDALALEDTGWINLSSMTANVIPSAERITTVKEARVYSLKDPLAKRAVALMTDYSFGSGITWSMKDEPAKKLLETFWKAPENKPLLSPKGQRKSSSKLLVDGEIFLAVFLGVKGAATIRRIDPLEITEIITDPDDIENVRYYKRDWADVQGGVHTSYYRSFANLKDEACKDAAGASKQKTDDGLIYHLSINDIGQRGNSYLLPVIEWVKLYRKFLASRVAVMLALARFAWKAKTKGGQTAVDTVKAKFHEEEVKAASTLVENEAVNMQPIKTESGASAAYQDGRQLKLQISAGTGWPEQYFGDISIGNLATAKTVELPVQKMCESYQAIWQGAYKDIFQLILTHNNVNEENQYVDMDFPVISEEMVAAMAQSMSVLCQIFPQFADSTDVQQRALMILGVQNPNEVLDQLKDVIEGNPNAALAKALRQFREVIRPYLLQEKMTPADWKDEYQGEVPHWAEDNAPSLFAKDFLKDLKAHKATRVLEIGCGNGRDSILFAKSGYAVTSIDIVPKAIELAKANAKKADMDIAFKVANAEKLPYADGDFDGVFSLSVLHSTNLAKSLSEVNRVLKPGSTAFIYIYGGTQFEDGKESEDTIAWPDYIKLLKTSGFKVLKSYTENEKEFDELGEKHKIYVTLLEK